MKWWQTILTGIGIGLLLGIIAMAIIAPNLSIQ